MANVLQTSSFAVSLALFFIAGIGLAFTPCVFPMVPILSTIIVGEGEGLTKTRAVTLSLAYVLGMALTYALVGLLVGLFGAELNLQATLQSPWVLFEFCHCLRLAVRRHVRFLRIGIASVHSSGLISAARNRAVGGIRPCLLWALCRVLLYRPVSLPPWPGH